MPKDLNPQDPTTIALDVTAVQAETFAPTGESFSVSEDHSNLEDKVISVERVSRTQEGGRRIRFRALVVVGDRQGNVGMGIGKSNEVVTAVAKATSKAKKAMFTFPIVRHTIPHEIVAKFDTAKVLLKPAPAGTSIIAGSSVRPILELAGVENIVAKCLTRTTNKYNIAYATLVALRSLKDIKEIAPRRYVKHSKKSVAAKTTAAPKEVEKAVEAPVAKPKTKRVTKPKKSA